MTMNISDSGHTPERAQGVRVSANAFSLLGERPIRGRDFREGEDKKGAEPVALLGYALWKTRYGSDPSVIGRAIKINEVSHTVVGIMAEGNRFPTNADLWTTMIPDGDLEKRQFRRIMLFGRLAPGVTVRQAQTELTGITQQLEQQYPDTNKTVSAEVMTFNDRFNGGPIRVVFLAMMGAPWASCCSSRARTLPTCCSRGPPGDRARSRCASPSAPVARASCASCSSKARCSRSSAACSALRCRASA
jgi:hypothetical protein